MNSNPNPKPLFPPLEAARPTSSHRAASESAPVWRLSSPVAPGSGSRSSDLWFEILRRIAAWWFYFRFQSSLFVSIRGQRVFPGSWPARFCPIPSFPKDSLSCFVIALRLPRQWKTFPSIRSRRAGIPGPFPRVGLSRLDVTETFPDIGWRLSWFALRQAVITAASLKLGRVFRGSRRGFRKSRRRRRNLGRGDLILRERA